LDVFAPPESKDLPVQVWIHGGGYNTGSATGVGGENIVAHSNGTLIFVSIQYRLGAYGFLSNAAVKENGAPNTGLLDMRAALDWIQRNIHAFGGDASKVTISGGSAGGGAVTNQLILYGGEENPPFRAAIPEYPWWQTYKTDAILDTQFRDLLIASNCTELDCLRNLSEKDLANATQATYQIAYESGNYAYGDFYYGPAVDGEIIRDIPSNEFKQGHFNKVALLTDHDGFEGAVFTNFSTTSTSQLMDNLQKLWPSADAAFWTRLSMLYPVTDFTGSYFDNDFFNSTVIASLASAFGLEVSNPQFWRAQDIYGDFVIDCPTVSQE
jgi:carboxylesterase type B